MRLPASILTLLAIALVSTPTPTPADTINLSTSFLEGSDLTADFTTTDLTFVLPTGFSNASLNISTFYADDRGVLMLNGDIVASTSFTSFSGPPSMILTEGGSNDPFVFQYTNGGGPFLPITTSFVAGLNTLHFIVNDTGNGWFGPLNPNSGPTELRFTANVTFDAPSAVPLPGALPLFASILGLGGFFRYRRKRKTA